MTLTFTSLLFCRRDPKTVNVISTGVFSKDNSIVATTVKFFLNQKDEKDNENESDSENVQSLNLFQFQSIIIHSFHRSLIRFCIQIHSHMSFTFLKCDVGFLGDSSQ